MTTQVSQALSWNKAGNRKAATYTNPMPHKAEEYDMLYSLQFNHLRYLLQGGRERERLPAFQITTLYAQKPNRCGVLVLLFDLIKTSSG